VRVRGAARRPPLALDELNTHLDDRGVSKEWFPERLVVLGALPRSSGGKVAKGDLAADIRRRLAEEAAHSGPGTAWTGPSEQGCPR
jgi:non-ribosomal peptide synthetase component E (peptide arylation enzyme)